MALKQDLRMGKLSTVLGKDVLVLQRFEGTDRMNGLFDYRVSCLAAQDSDVDFDQLMGTHATVTLKGQDGSDRHFDGLVTEGRWLGSGDNGQRFELRLQPWFWLATMRRNQRIFHEKNVIDILNEVLAAYAAAGTLKVDTSGQYPTLEYTVQYNESDFNFCCRMMERHGISYHFAFSEGGHDMVLTDGVEAHENVGSFPVKPYVGHHQEDTEHLWEWRPGRRMATGAIRMTDYNFKTPTVVMEKDQTGTASYEHGQVESFDWPGDYLDPGRGIEMVQLGLKREGGRDKRYQGMGDISNLVSGKKMTVSGDSDPVPGKGAEYLCLVSQHSYTSDNYGSGGSSGDEFAYTGRYTFLPVEAPMIPERKTPRADVRGPMTAKVVGADGEEIDCDEYGRILVQFHWDLSDARSMRCRVAQNWSGGTWGGMIIPRIGMEVLVEFLDGDPDKPLVTGCVYNGKNMPAYPLPANKTKSVFRTDSHKAKGFNELVFEDESPDEHIAFKAQKDMSRLVLNNSISRVKNDDIENVGRNKLFEVRNSFALDAGKSVTITAGQVGPDVNSAMARTSGLRGIAGTHPLAVHGGFGRTGLLKADETGADANHAMRNAGKEYGDTAQDLSEAGMLELLAVNYRQDVTGMDSHEVVGRDRLAAVGGDMVHEVGGNVKLVTNRKVDINAMGNFISNAMTHTMVSATKFTIATPGAKLELGPTGLTISALTVKVKSASVDFNMGAGGQAAQLKGTSAFVAGASALLGPQV